jgi:adenylate cyclase
MARKIKQAFVIGAGSALVALGLWHAEAPALLGLERVSWSHRVQLFAKPAETTAKIKVILLDQPSLDWAEKEMALPWPWPRSVYVPVFEFLKRGGAKSVSFDVLFTEGSGEDHVGEDVLLGEGFARLPGVAAVFLGEHVTRHRTWPAHLPRPRARPEGFIGPAPDAGAAFPVPEVATNATLLASVKEVADPDGVFRRVGLYRIFDGEAVPTLGLAPLLATGTVSARFDRLSFQVDRHRVPVDEQQRVLLRFRGRSGTHQSFSAAAVIQSEARLEAGEPPTIAPEVFKDCHVFFGFSAPGLKDLRPTPVSGDYPGVEIHATLLDNLLAGDALRDAPGGLVSAVLALLCLAAAGAVIASRTTAQNVAAFAVFLPIPYGAALAGYAAGWWWPMAPGLLGVALALVGGVVWNYATEGRQKRFLKSAFNQYVGAEVLDELVAHPEKLASAAKSAS